MVHPKLRRVLAASALVAAVSLVPVAGANAAVRARAHRTPAVASRIETGAAWLRDLVLDVLEKAGDPDRPRRKVTDAHGETADGEPRSAGEGRDLAGHRSGMVLVCHEV